MIAMTQVTDLSGAANFERFLDFLILGLTAAMIFYGLCAARNRSDAWPKILWISAAVAFLAQGSLVLAQAGREGLRSLEESQETPGLPLTYETWDLLGGLGVFLFGLGLLGSGVAFIYLAWLEGKHPRPRKRAPRKRAKA